MEPHEIIEAMEGLKLHGMRASFDEIAGKGPWPGAMNSTRSSPA